MLRTWVLLAAGGCLFLADARGAGGRTAISLNGTWKIAESVSATEVPRAFDHAVIVPGLVNLSQPAFPEVDLFASHYYFARFGRVYPWGSTNTLLRAEDPLPVIGTPVNQRNYFWYRKTFAPPAKREVALLKIGKSQFGTKVWLNGKAAGEHLSCWTAGYFNLTDAMNWSGENQLIVRIGAHPAVLPENIPGAGTYSSKHKWTPGIYDDVSLILCDNPVIESIQVAPRIGSSEVVIQTKVRNYGPARTFELSHSVSTWKEGQEVVRMKPQTDKIGAGEAKTYTQTNRIENARLWSPEDPFLYLVESRTGGDSLATRFGMREYRFDSATKRGCLNGKPYYLRGGNIELHLYFEDPECGRRSWDRAWVKKLVADIPKRIHWNAFRFCLSPVPEMWLDIADEEGILVQPEPIVWDWTGAAHGAWSPDEFAAEYARWMRDLWNHPCVFMWDSSNETSWGALAGIVNRVRSLDLSNRAWDNSYAATAGPNDPTEAHPYNIRIGPDLRTIRGFNPDDTWGGWNWSGTGAGHPCLINEYAWLWLYSDGTPLDLTGSQYQGMPVAERQDFRFYVTAALTEMWRAQGRACGIFDYLYFGSYLPRKTGPYHFGDFVDPVNLKLHPEFERYMIDAFKPLGVYLKFWGDGKPGTELTRSPWFPIYGGAEREFDVVLVNDDQEPVSGKLVLSLETLDGKVLATAGKPFRLEAVGRNTYKLSVPVPKESGRYLLNAAAHPEGTRHQGTTVSRRKLSVVPLPPSWRRTFAPAYGPAVEQSKPVARWALTPADKAGALRAGVNQPRVSGLPTGAYSVEFWFVNRLPNRERLITAYLLSRGQTTRGDHVGICGTYRQGEMAPGRLFVWNGTEPDQSVCGRTELAADQWYQVVFVREGKSVRVYLNGREEPEISGQAEPGCTAEAGPLHLGRRDDGFAELDGQVDQVSVYDRVLAPTEISAHYRAANPAPAGE